MESFMDRTPGSRIEEKDYSLAWHYRTSDPEQASFRARELKETLINLTSNLGIGVLEGNKVIEVKNHEVNKGRAALRWVKRGKYGFIMSVGDDWTDEDIFSVLNKNAYTIKVGLSFTKARFKVDSYVEVLALLEKLAGGVDEQSR
jgi:trehalose 6-phosphate synthase/phosphatase